jgi:hypothetical protein
VADFQGTGLTSDPTGLTGYVKKFGRVSLNNKVIMKKPSFVELLQKYQKMAKQKQNNQLRDQSWNSSSPKANKHQWSSQWSASSIPSMHVPWTAYSGIHDYSPYFWYNPWFSFYNYQYACENKELWLASMVISRFRLLDVLFRSRNSSFCKL